MCAQKTRRSTSEVGGTPPSTPTVRLSTSQHDLLARAIAALGERFDSDCNLLVHPAVEKFRSVRESLCYAALLLADQESVPQPDPTRVDQAVAVVDAVLGTQVTGKSAKELGAFPLAWAPEGNAADLLDAETRQTVGSMLGMIASRFANLLGVERVQQIEIALHRCCVGERAGRIDAARAHAKMMHAWLDLEYGYEAGGERLAGEVTQLPRLALRVARLGDSQTLAQQLWSIGLWFHNAKLGSWAARFGMEAWQDVTSWRHPDLSTLFGAGVRSKRLTRDGPPGSERLWHQVWLSWLDLTRNCDLLDLDDPRAAAMLALPVLAAQQDARSLRKGLDAQPDERIVSERLPGIELSGWFEKNLHIETTRLPEARRGEVVMAAYWPTRSGIARMLCRTSKGLVARCDKRFVRLDRPGVADVQISGLGAGEARMIENGWWLAGLHLGMEGFQISDARRTEDGLRLTLRASVDEPLLLFAPLSD